MCRGSQWVLCCCQLSFSWLFLCPSFCENQPPKKKAMFKKQGKNYGKPLKPEKAHNMLNWSDKVKTRFVGSSMSLAKVCSYGKNE